MLQLLLSSLLPAHNTHAHIPSAASILTSSALQAHGGGCAGGAGTERCLETGCLASTSAVSVRQCSHAANCCRLCGKSYLMSASGVDAASAAEHQQIESNHDVRLAALASKDRYRELLPSRQGHQYERKQATLCTSLLQLLTHCLSTQSDALLIGTITLLSAAAAAPVSYLVGIPLCPQTAPPA